MIIATRGSFFFWLWYNEKGGDFYNKAYFTPGQYITKWHIQEQVKKWETIITWLNNILEQIEHENILNDIQKTLIKGSIYKSILLLKYHQNAIYIEAEKAWYRLSNKDRIFYRKEILHIEDLLYGKDITHLTGRKDKVIHKLHETYTINHQELSSNEQHIRQEKILNIFQQPRGAQWNTINVSDGKDMYIDEKHIFELISLVLEIEWLEAKDIVKIQMNNTIQDIYFDQKQWIYHVPVERKDKEIYTYLKKEGIGQKFKIIRQLTWNNSVTITKSGKEFGKNHISISPPVGGKYNITKKILPIIYDHEISTHANTWIGNIKNISIKEPERSDLEEWIALANQTLAQGKSLEELYEASIWDIWMFLGEHFDEQELQKLLHIYFKLTKDTTQNLWDRVRRIKMWIPLWDKWARRKDLTYGNSKEIIQELEQLTKTPQGIELLNKYAKAIYSTKLWYEAIKNIDEILDGITTLDELEPNFPIFAGKIIYRKLFKGKLDKDKMLENDLRSVIQTNKIISIAQKRLLVKILKILQTHWEIIFQ